MAPHSDPHRQKVLVVDDHADNRALMELILEERYDVTCLESGNECLKKAAIICPDIIILDVNMPGMDGFEVCRQLKEDPSTEMVPVVFVTAMDMEVEQAEGFDAGGEEYITKPVDADQLLASVGALLEFRSLH